jgi:hypothetical protein
MLNLSKTTARSAYIGSYRFGHTERYQADLACCSVPRATSSLLSAYLIEVETAQPV